MYRKITDFLETRKCNPHHKPLILQGARQVEKTYAILEFARTHYENVAYFNFETNPALSKTFDEIQRWHDRKLCPRTTYD